MIVSLVLKGMYNIGLNANNKLKVNGNIIEKKEIPIIRYRFSQYGDNELAYIKKMMAKFNEPVHMAEIYITAGDDVQATIDSVKSLGNIAVFLYVDITDTEVVNGLSDEMIATIAKLTKGTYDRIMLRDKSSMLYPLRADDIKKVIRDTCGFKAKDIGVCGSPISFRNGNESGQACLTAVWARQIMARYASSPDIATPTANHECMDCCGCTKYFVIDSDLPAPLSSKERAKSSEDKGEPVPKKLKGTAAFMSADI